MSPPVFRQKNLALLLLQTREAVMAHFRPLLNEHGVTEQQWRIIRELADEGPLEPRQLSVNCAISSPSITGVLVRLEEQGLVERRRMEGDQRRRLVSLTPRSRALVRRMVPRVQERYRALEQRLGAELVHDVYEVLHAVLGRLQADGDAPEDGAGAGNE